MTVGEDRQSRLSSLGLHESRSRPFGVSRAQKGRAVSWEPRFGELLHVSPFLRCAFTGRRLWHQDSSGALRTRGDARITMVYTHVLNRGGRGVLVRRISLGLIRAPCSHQRLTIMQYLSGHVCHC